MQRLNVAFLAVVVLAAGLGAVASVGYGGDLDARSDAGAISRAVEADVTSLSIEGEELHVTTTLRNPTEQDLAVTGAVVRVHNATERKLAFGTGNRLSGETDLPAGGSATATYSIRISPSKAAALRHAVSTDGVSVTTKYTLRYRGVSIQTVATDDDPRGGGG